MSKFIITLSREFGSNGRLIGQMLADKLGIKYYDKELIRLASEQSGINEKFFNLADEKISGKFNLFKKNKTYKGNVLPPQDDAYLSSENLFSLQAEVIKTLADKESCVIVGRCADYILKDYKNVINVFCYATNSVLYNNIAGRYGISLQEAEKLTEKTNKSRSEYHKVYTNTNWYDTKNYTLCINCGEIDPEESVLLIEEVLKSKLSENK